MAGRLGVVLSWVVAECCCRVLIPQLSPVVLDRIDRVDGTVLISAHPRARASRCRRCARVSTRLHSRYRRHLADLPVSGHPVEASKPRGVMANWVRRWVAARGTRFGG